MMRDDQPPRVFDRDQAVKTLANLEAIVVEYRRTHRSDDGIKVRLGRIHALRSMLNKPIEVEEELG